jgi:hypothetical protein
MGQRSLHEYFSFKANSPPPGLSFLNLPYNVRHRIYDLAGLLHQSISISKAEAEKSICSSIYLMSY